MPQDYHPPTSSSQVFPSNKPTLCPRPTHRPSGPTMPPPTRPSTPTKLTPTLLPLLQLTPAHDNPDLQRPHSHVNQMRPNVLISLVPCGHGPTPPRSIVFVQASWPCAWPRPCRAVAPRPPHPWTRGLPSKSAASAPSGCMRAASFSSGSALAQQQVKFDRPKVRVIVRATLCVRRTIVHATIHIMPVCAP